MERKTIRDLRASLHDMRLDDQYQRLKSSRLNTVFLLEQPFTTNPELTRYLQRCILPSSSPSSSSSPYYYYIWTLFS
jgi:ERCC4-type nuclease